jgi:2-dehydropantoate 2-reductase
MGSLKTTSSTLQSLQRGRPTEINFLNGEIVSIGEKLSIATPFNKGIVTTVKEVERSGRFFTPEELVDRLL